MNRIRVLIVEMPQLLTDILEATVVREPEIDLAGVLASAGDIDATLRHCPADVVVCRLAPGNLPAVYRDLFEVHPHLRLLAIEPGERAGSVYALRPTHAALDVCPRALVAAIRSAGPAGAGFAWDAAVETP